MDFNAIMQKMFQENPELQALLPQSASYRYYQGKNKDQYFYTTEKMNHKGNQRYVVGVYRYLKSKKQWKCMKHKVGFAKKKLAMAAAYKWYQKENGGDIK